MNAPRYATANSDQVESREKAINHAKVRRVQKAKCESEHGPALSGRSDRELTHISLFTGIGGFDLAASWAGFRTIAMCEIDPFCQEVLKERFGAVSDPAVAGPLQSAGTGIQDGTHGPAGTDSVPRKARFGAVADTCLAGLSRGEHETICRKGRREEGGATSECPPLLIPDIRDFDGRRFRGATLLTGGFPCQPFSHAGKRRGTSDDRHLWPEMLRVIDEARPTFVIGENVSGIRSLEIGQGDADLEGDTVDEPGGEDEYTIVLDGVCRDLEGIGYEVQPLIIPACAVNAPHRRDRVWIIAHQNAIDCRGGVGEPQEQVRQRNERDALAGDGKRIHCQSHTNADSDAPDTEGGESRLTPQQEGREDSRRGSGETGWDIPWIEVATRFCRVDDGLPAWVHSRRVARLKALGNAIVPQVAHQIIRNIAIIEKKR